MTVPGPAVLDIPSAVEAARALRRELDVRVDDPLPCVLSLAEDHLGLDVVVAPLPLAWSGFYLPRPTRGLIAVNGIHAVVRQRFTIAHELGHHVLGHGAAPRVVAIAETPSAVEVAPGAARDAPAGGPAAGGTLGEGGASTGFPEDATTVRSGEGGAPTGFPEDLTTVRSGEARPSTGPVDDATTLPSGDASDPRASSPAVSAPVPETPRKPSEPKERAANAFAAELLCPASAARSFVARHATAGSGGEPEVDFDLVVRMSAAFGLSAWAVVMRLGTAKVLANGPVRDGLQARVHAAEHIPRYLELGLSALSDELELVASTGLPRMPEGIDGALLLSVIDPDRSPDTLPPPLRELRRMLGLDGGPA